MHGDPLERQQTDLWASIGVHLVPNAVSPELLDRLLDASDNSPTEPAVARTIDGVDAQFRRSRRVNLPQSLAEALRGLFELHRSEMEQFFGVTLMQQHDPQLLVYRSGDHFAIHVDVAPHGSGAASNRIVTSVLVLDPQSDGGLVLYGLTGDAPVLRRIGLRLPQVRGALLWFRSSVPHEVTPVNHGRRVTAVTWFEIRRSL